MDNSDLWEKIMDNSDCDNDSGYLSCNGDGYGIGSGNGYSCSSGSGRSSSYGHGNSDCSGYGIKYDSGNQDGKDCVVGSDIVEGLLLMGKTYCE